MAKFKLRHLRPDLRERLAHVPQFADQTLKRTSWLKSDRHVVCITKLDERHFQMLTERWPKLGQLARRTAVDFPTFPELLQDIFYALYLAQPRFRGRTELLPAYQRNADVMHQIQKLDLYAYSRDNARLNEGAAMIGTVTIAERILEGLPEEEKEEAKEEIANQARNQEERDQLEDLKQQLEKMLQEQLEQTETADDAAGEEPEEATAPSADDSSPGETGPQGGNPAQVTDGADHPGEADGTALDDEPSDEDLARFEQALEKLLDELEANAERLPEAPPDGGSSLDENKLRRLARQGLKAANTQMNDINEAISAWGSDSGEWNALPIGDRMELAERLTRIPQLNDFAAEIGRFRQEALFAARQPGAVEAQEIVGVEIGGELAALLDSELALLADPDLELLLYATIAMEEALQYEYSGRAPSGMGPFIVLTDISGSMQGIKERWAKAFIIAALEIAKKDNRNVAVILFDTKIHEPVMVFPGGRATLAEKAYLAQSFANGGTNWQPALEAALANIEDETGDWKTADIVLVTDGIYKLSPEFTAQYVRRCQAKGIRTHGVLLDCGDHLVTTLQPFCDQAYGIQTLRGVGEASTIFRQLALKG